MQQWIELAATAGSLCNLAAAAVNLAATVIKYRRERKSTARETDQRPVDVHGGQSRPLAQGHPEGGQDLRDQVAAPPLATIRPAMNSAATGTAALPGSPLPTPPGRLGRPGGDRASRPLAPRHQHGVRSVDRLRQPLQPRCPA